MICFLTRKPELVDAPNENHPPWNTGYQKVFHFCQEKNSFVSIVKDLRFFIIQPTWIQQDIGQAWWGLGRDQTPDFQSWWWFHNKYFGDKDGLGGGGGA